MNVGGVLVVGLYPLNTFNLQVVVLSPNLLLAIQLYFPASSSEMSKISKIASPSSKVMRFLDDGRIGILFFSHETSQSDTNNEHVSFTEDEFSVIVRSLNCVPKRGLSRDELES